MLENYALGSWHRGQGVVRHILDSTTGEPVAEMADTHLDFTDVVRHARNAGGPALRSMGFQQRAELLKSLAKALGSRKAELYELSRTTGATQADCILDVEGGLGTLHAYAARGARELPAGNVYFEGPSESLTRSGGFLGQHICVPRQGVAVHINAFNFPVWGMLEKLAPTILAGMPAIVKPASATAHVAEHLVRQIVECGLLPDGALQLIVGSVGSLLDHLAGQDVLTVTGSASTAQTLRSHDAVVRRAVRFSAEADSLNACVLGPDAQSGTPEFDLFVAEVVREMSYKAGQRCTAIRRVLVPAASADAAAAALVAAFDAITVGDPRNKDVQMGPLVGREQRQDVLARIAQLRVESDLLTGDPLELRLRDADADRGAFIAPTLLRVRDGMSARIVHEVEAFGPVCTLVPYHSLEDAVELARRGQGSLVASLFSSDIECSATLVSRLAPYHGRILVVDRHCGSEQTGHGSPLPALVHGGPGRAGGGEELGGLRAVLHYLQRTAVQGTPELMRHLAG